MPLWRSLLLNLADRFAPERLAPLELTSEPVDVGLMLGDQLALPWFRTVFTNLGDVISPDSLPPLALTSRPIDVGELLGDGLDHGWLHSLMGQLRDRLSPERLPALQLSSHPIDAYGSAGWLQVLDWSSLLDSPKVFLPDAPQADGFAAASPMAGFVAAEAAAASAPAPDLLMVQMQFKRDISRSRFRQKIWISMVAAEVVVLLAYLVHFK